MFWLITKKQHRRRMRKVLQEMNRLKEQLKTCEANFEDEASTWAREQGWTEPR